MRLVTPPVFSYPLPVIATQSDILQRKYPFFVDDDAITLDRALAWIIFHHWPYLSFQGVIVVTGYKQFLLQFLFACNKYRDLQLMLCEI